MISLQYIRTVYSRIYSRHTLFFILFETTFTKVHDMQAGIRTRNTHTTRLRWSSSVHMIHFPSVGIPVCIEFRYLYINGLYSSFGCTQALCLNSYSVREITKAGDLFIMSEENRRCPFLAILRCIAIGKNCNYKPVKERRKRLINDTRGNIT